MGNEPYSAAVRACFADMRHAGDLANAVTAQISDQGVSVQLAGLRENGRIAALRFRAWGCPHLIAACERFCAEHEGRPLADLAEFAANDIMRKLSVPIEKTGRILVLEDAVRLLGQGLRDDGSS